MTAAPGWPVRANRLVGAAVIGLMVVMAGTGLTYALLTVHTRREHDRALPRKPRRPWLSERTPTPEEAVAPAQLPALGYLPASTGVVAAVQVQELLASPAGKELRSQPLRVGGTGFSLDSVKDWTGLEAEDVDHAVLGVAVRDGEDADLTPPVHLVVRTRRPYNPARVRLALKATRPHEERAPGGGKRTLYAASVRGVPVQLWLADERTLVLGLFSDLAQVPAAPQEGLAQLPAELRRVIEQRLAAGVPAWVAGHSADWKKTWLPALLARRKDVPVLGRLEQVRTFALWLVPSRPAKLAGAFRCGDEAQARKVEAEELAPREKEHPETFKYTREGAWLDVQLTLGQAKADEP
jgi:hypothetical protein